MDSTPPCVLLANAGGQPALAAAAIRAFYQAGRAVVLMDCAEDMTPTLSLDLREAMTEAREQGFETTQVHVDFTSGTDIELTIGRAARVGAPIRGLVVLHLDPHGPTLLSESLEEYWWQDFSFPVRMAYALTRQVIPHLQQAGGGTIVHLVSTGATHARKLASAPNAAHAAIVQLVRDTALECGPDRIRAHALLVDDLQSPSHDVDNAAVAILLGVTPGELARLATDSIPLQRLPTPEDVGALLAFLVGDGASYLTGLTIPVSGGANL